MTFSTALLEQPMHIIAQKSRRTPSGSTVCISERQNRTMPLNTAAQKAGVRYENRVEKHLQRIVKEYGCELHSHIWFEVDGRAAQTDFFLLFPSDTAILFEVKQTWVDTSNQLAFYKNLLIGLGFNSVTCCTICKNLTPETPRPTIIQSFEDMKEAAVWQIRD